MSFFIAIWQFADYAMRLEFLHIGLGCGRLRARVVLYINEFDYRRRGAMYILDHLRIATEWRY